MNYTLVFILGASIIFPAIAGWVRFNKIDPAYYFFIFLIWAGFANECLNFLIITNGGSNALNSNIYALIEGIVILFFFNAQKLFTRDKRIFFAILILLVSSWIADKLIIARPDVFSPYYLMIASFVYVLMSISLINRVILVEHTKASRNGLFLICLCFICFFTYALLVEIFMFYGLIASKEFQLRVYRIMSYINALTNLAYALAILWIPTKQRSILL